MSFRLRVSRLGPGWLVLLGCFPAGPAVGAPRRVAIRAPESLVQGGELERIKGWARRSGVLLEVGAEQAPAPPGSEIVWLALTPVSEAFAKAASRFPVKLEPDGFEFDGRRYRAPEDAIALSDPARPRETLVLGNGRQALLRLAARRMVWRDEPRADYQAVSGGLTKEGRFAKGTPLAIERASDRDGITARDAFFAARRIEERDGARWVFREEERPAVDRWAPVLKRWLPRSRRAPVTVALFPDAGAKAKYAGSSRPADLAEDGAGFRVDVDASALAEPDLVSPVLASAALAAETPALARRPLLLAAAGARAAGSWWGRPVAPFAAFARGAGVEPSPSEVLGDEAGLSPVLSVGAAAAWLEAGARLEGEGAMKKALAGPGPALGAALERWRSSAARQAVRPPARRELPRGFLRGVSYAMTNSIDGGYASSRSHDTLAKLAGLSVNSVAIMPFAFSRDPHAPEIAFIHRDPQGETDEAMLHAAADARVAGMTTMWKPQIWLAGGFVGTVSMKSEDDWRGWFDAYRRFVVHHAVVAEAGNASAFCVGTELLATEAREKDWRRTVAAVRLATGAPLLYAANWAANAPNVTFWDALDAVGVDFYDPLSRDPKASDAALETGARAAARPLAALAERVKKPVIFAEAGYPPVRAAWLSPHDENSGRPRAPEDAARAVAAVYRALEKERWWKGVYWWKAFSDGRPARPDETGFNLIGTPAEKAVAAGFAKLAAVDR